MKFLSSQYKENKLKFIFTVLLLGCVICQMLITLYFNIFEAKNHLGIDSSWEYLKAIVAGDYKGIYPIKLLSDTTAPWINRSILLAIPFYKICGNIFVSYALANLIITVLTIIFMVSIMRLKKYDITAILIVINLFICPYLLNYYSWHTDLEYFSCVLAVSPYYNVVILLLTMIYRILVASEIKGKEKVIMAISAILSVISGMGAGLSIIAMVFIPLILARITMVFMYNSLDALKNWKSIFVGLLSVLAFLGQFIGKAIGFKYENSIAAWTTAERLWANLGKLIVGFLKLLGAIPIEEKVSSPTSKEGVFHLFAIVICVVVLTSVAFALKKVVESLKNKNEVDEFVTTLVVIIISTFVEFLLIDTAYGAEFEDRYLILALISAFFLVGYFINSIDEQLLIRRFGIAALFLSIVLIDLRSDYVYKQINNEEYMMDEMVAYIEGTDAGLIYAWGNDTSIYEHCLRVFDSNRVYKLINNRNELNTWGDYLYYDDSTLYSGSTILMLSGDSDFVPDEIMEQYKYVTTIHAVDFYYCESNPIDTKELSKGR